MFRSLRIAFLVGVLALAAQGCGSSGSSSSASSGSSSAPASSGSSTSAAGSTGSAGGTAALSAEAKSAATGDIPDNQVYLSFHNPAAGYTIKYPEGWTRNGTGSTVTFSDKNNIIRIVIGHGSAPTTAGLAAELSRLKQSNASLSFVPPTTIQLKSGPAVKSTYLTTSAPNSVTGKSIVLMVDRYELANSTGKRATVDLGTAKGVDTVDAYRMIINSFRWQ